MDSLLYNIAYRKNQDHSMLGIYPRRQMSARNNIRTNLKDLQPYIEPIGENISISLL